MRPRIFQEQDGKTLAGSIRAAKLFRRGARGRNRTTDTRIFSPLLYQLSYPGLGANAAVLNCFTLRESIVPEGFLAGNVQEVSDGGALQPDPPDFIELHELRYFYLYRAGVWAGHHSLTPATNE